MLFVLKKHCLLRIKDERDRRILLAALSAFGAKFGGIALQLFSMPLVVRTLGVQDFSIFAIASSIIAFVMFSNLGIDGYVVTAVVSAKNNKGRNGNVPVIMANALTVTLSSALLFLVAGITYSKTLGLGSLFGGMYAYAPASVTQVFYIVLLLGAAQSVMTIFVAAQNGYQELYISNLYGGGGNLLSALAIAAYYFLSAEKTVVGYLLSLYLPLITSYLLNAIHFLLRHPEARPRFKAMNCSLAGAAICSGGAFFVAQTAMPITIREFPKMLMASKGELDQVTTYALLMILWTMLSGVIKAFTQPLFGSIADAWSNGHYKWVFDRLIISIGLFILSGIGLIFAGYYFGTQLTAIWVGVDASIDSSTMSVFGLFFGLAGMFHLFTIIIYAMNLRLQCMMLNIVTALCIFLAILLLGKSVSAFNILALISMVLGCISTPTAMIIMNNIYRNRSRFT